MTAEIQVSTRLDNGTIMVIGGGNPDEFRNNLTGIVGEFGRDEIIAEFLKLVPTGISPSDAAHNLAQAGLVSQPAAQNVAQQYQPPAPQYQQPAAVQRAAAPAPPGQDTPSCQHGPRKYMSGTGKTGKYWQAYMCPAPKGTPDQCEPSWIR